MAVRRGVIKVARAIKMQDSSGLGRVARPSLFGEHLHAASFSDDDERVKTITTAFGRLPPAFAAADAGGPDGGGGASEVGGGGEVSPVRNFTDDVTRDSASGRHPAKPILSPIKKQSLPTREIRGAGGEGADHGTQIRELRQRVDALDGAFRRHCVCLT